MHEIGLCEGLVDTIAERAAGRQVTGVRVRIGVRHAVLNDAFDQAFALVTAGTVAEGAELDLVLTPVTVTCRGCGGSVDSQDALAVCGHCGGADVDISGGDEMVLESIQLAAQEAQERSG
ncbi:MAG: hydrogenase maturation nickel metallochaperone HypA [Micromonosporaceae bacterium]